jgi:hypothetical protein
VLAAVRSTALERRINDPLSANQKLSISEFLSNGLKVDTPSPTEAYITFADVKLLATSLRDSEPTSN